MYELKFKTPGGKRFHSVVACDKTLYDLTHLDPKKPHSTGQLVGCTTLYVGEQPPHVHERNEREKERRLAREAKKETAA